MASSSGHTAGPDPFPSCAEAAREFLAIEAQEDAAYKAFKTALSAWQTRRSRPRSAKPPQDDPEPLKPSRTSLRAFAERTPYSKSGLSKHIVKIRHQGFSARSTKPRGHPPYLEPWEDEALVRYVVRLSNGTFPTVKEMLVAAANTMRSMRQKPPVGSHFIPRWLAKHPELRSVLIKPVEAARQSLEVALEDIDSFFNKYEAAVQSYGLVPSGIWNADECGNRIGVLSGRIQCIVVATERKARAEVYNFNNRESMTLIGCGSAVGDAIPAYCIFKQWPSPGWAKTYLHDEVRFNRSDTGFSNAEIMLDWVQHFNQHSYTYHAELKRLGYTLKEWFGVDSTEKFDWRQEDDPKAMASGQRAQHQRIYRCLIIDGFSGHHSISILDYCFRFDIIVVFLPPHSTHLLQPMDVGVFQWLKAKHRQILTKKVRCGDLSFTRNDFVQDALQPMIDHAFTAMHILSGFARTGLWPINSQFVISDLTNKQKKTKRAKYPQLLPSLSAETDAQSLRTAARLLDHYADLLSSGTRRGLNMLNTMATESVLLKGKLAEDERNKSTRMMKYKNSLTRKQVKPDGEVMTSLTVGDIRRQNALSEEKDRQAEIRRIKRIGKREEAKARKDEAQKKTAMRKEQRTAWKKAGHRYEGQPILFRDWLMIYCPEAQLATQEEEPTTPPYQLVPDLQQALEKKEEEKEEDSFISVSSDVEISGLGLGLERPLHDVNMASLSATQELYTAMASHQDE